MKTNKWVNLLSNPKKILRLFWERLGGNVNDELYLRVWYYLKTGERLRLDSPQTFNEKLQWLKLNDTKAINSTELVDKYLAKAYVAQKIGVEYIIPTLGVWENVDEIDFDKLPEQFVLKCTHNSGGLIICHDKSRLDISEAKIKLSNDLQKNFYKFAREYVYQNVKPRIIAEKLMTDKVHAELRDYKIFCFNGKPQIFMIASGRQNNQNTTTFFDMAFNRLGFTSGYPNSAEDYSKPNGFEKMKELAEILSEGFLHLRVDFYEVDGQIYFGEMTFYHLAGGVLIKPKEWDYRIGEMLRLPH